MRKFKDLLAEKLMWLVSGLVLSLAFLMVWGLYLRSKPILELKGLGDLFFSSLWRPAAGHFGLLTFIAGTFWVTAIAMLIAVPLSILTAIYLSEYLSRRARELVKPMLDVLAGISPVVYGVWGVIAIVPLVRDYLMPFFSERFPFFPFLSDNYTGFSILAGGIVLAVMVFPIIISVADEVLISVPFEIREASLALGATRWQTVKLAVLRKARAGIFAAVILGLSRAFGETMAVLMVTGCTFHGFPNSIFDPAYPLPALIANTYGEMMSIPLYDAAIMLAALVLLVITAGFNIFAWVILLRLQRQEV